MSSPTYSTLESSVRGSRTLGVETTTVAYVLASFLCCFSATTRGEVLLALTSLSLLSSSRFISTSSVLLNDPQVSLCGISSGGYFVPSVL